MVTYDFYENVYLGIAIPEKAFPGLAAKAFRVLERFRRIYRVAEAGEAEVKLALCAMAETLYDYRKHGGVKSTSVGSVSVQYSGDRHCLSSDLLERAEIYLDIYRGVDE